MAWQLFHNYLLGVEQGSPVDFESDTVNIMLITSTRAPVQATDADMATIDDNEVSGDGYTAGGETIANAAATLDAGTITVDCDDVTWSQGASGFTDARYAVMYKDTGNPATDIPIAFNDFGSDKGNDTGDLTLEMDSNGIFQKTES